MSDYLQEPDKSQVAYSEPVILFAKCVTCKEKIAKLVNDRQTETYKCACRRGFDKKLQSLGVDPITLRKDGKELTHKELFAIVSGKGANPSSKQGKG